MTCFILDLVLLVRSFFVLPNNKIRLITSSIAAAFCIQCFQSVNKANAIVVVVAVDQNEKYQTMQSVLNQKSGI